MACLSNIHLSPLPCGLQSRYPLFRWWTGRRVAGAVSTVAIVVSFGVLGALISVGLSHWQSGFWVEALLVSVLIAQNSLYRHVADVAGRWSATGLKPVGARWRTLSGVIPNPSMAMVLPEAPSNPLPRTLATAWSRRSCGA